MKREDHRFLETLRDLFAAPAVAFACLWAFGELAWLANGSTSEGFCGDGLNLLGFAGIAALVGAVAWSKRLTRHRAAFVRGLIVFWNGIAVGLLLFFVLLGFHNSLCPT